MGAYDDLMPGSPAPARGAPAGGYDDLLPAAPAAPSPIVAAAKTALQPVDVPRGTLPVSQGEMPTAEEIAAASRPAQMTMTRRGQPVLDGRVQAPQRASEVAMDAPAAAKPGTAGYVAQGPLSGIETAARMALGLVGSTGAAAGVGTAALADVATNPDARLNDVAERVRQGITEGPERVLPKPVFAPTPQLEEALGHGFEAARDATGQSLEAMELARGQLAQGIVPDMLKEYVKARPEAARTLGEAGFDTAMLATPAVQALKGARGAGIAATARAAAADDARFANAKDVTPQPAPPGTPQLPSIVEAARAGVDSRNASQAATVAPFPAAVAGRPRIAAAPAAREIDSVADATRPDTAGSGSGSRALDLRGLRADVVDDVKSGDAVSGHEIKSPETFHQLISQAKSEHPFGAAVTTYPAEDYAGMRTFVSPDGYAGVAVKPDGDMVSVFKSPKAPPGISHVDPLIEHAIKSGAVKADAFDTVLPDYYAQHGFRVVARLPFDPTHAPEGWNPEQFKAFNGGRPDVVFMVHDPKRVLGKFENYTNDVKPSLQYAKSYDDAVAAQNQALAQVRGSSVPNLKVYKSARDADRTTAEKVIHQFLSKEALKRGFNDAGEMQRRDPKTAARLTEEMSTESPFQNIATGGDPMDAYNGFKSVTGKFPWEMPFEQFYKHTISKVKEAVPGKPAQWYQNVLRNEWTKAKEAGSLVTGGDPQMGGANEGVVRRQLQAELDKAETMLPKFKVMARNLAEKLGGTSIVAPVKGVDRALDKAINDYNGDVTQMKDLVRGTIVLNYPSDVTAAVNNRIMGHRITKNTNLYADPGPGYKDGKHVYSFGKIAAEMQFNTPEMMGAKEHAHPIYVMIEKIRRDNDGKPLSAAQAAIVEKGMARMNEIYAAGEAANKAREAAGERMSPAELETTARYLMARGDSLGRAEARNLLNSSSEIARSEAGLGARNGLGGSLSNAVQPPPGRMSATTGIPEQSQKDLGMRDSIVTGGDPRNAVKKRVDSMGFYSALEHAIESLSMKAAPAEQWIATIKSLKGVKQAEIDHSNVINWLKAYPGKKIEKSAVLDVLKQSRLKTDEHKFGGEDADDMSNEVSDRAWELYQDEIYEGIDGEMPKLPTVEVTQLQPDMFREQEGWRYEIKPGEPGYIDDYPNSREQRDEVADAYDAWRKNGMVESRGLEWNFEPEQSEKSYPTEAAAREAGDARAKELYNDEVNRRGEYANDHGDGPSDYHYEQAQREIGGGAETHFETYTLKGGDNYREIFLTAPKESASWKDGHSDFNSVKNPIVRFRVKDRTGMVPGVTKPGPELWKVVDKNGGEARFPDGRKMVFTSRIDAEKAALEGGRGVESVEGLPTTKRAHGLFVEELQPPSKSGFGQMPEALQKNWMRMGLKRLLTIAADEGYDFIAFANGLQTAGHYNMADHVREMSWKKSPVGDETEKVWRLYDSQGNHVQTFTNEPGDGYQRGYRVEEGTRPLVTSSLEDKDTKNIVAQLASGERLTMIVKNGEIISAGTGDSYSSAGRSLRGHKLTEVVGDGIAKQIESNETGSLKGEGLAIGGEKLRALYDKVIPNTLADVLKSLGGKVEMIDMARKVAHDQSKNYEHLEPHKHPGKQLGVIITDAMKEKIGEGLATFGDVDLRTNSPEKLGFGASPTYMRNMQPLDPGELKFVNGIVQDIAANSGMPADVANSIKAYVKYSSDVSAFGAGYWAERDVIGFHFDRIGQHISGGSAGRRMARGIIAHELAHHLDYDPAGGMAHTNETAKFFGSNYMSARSPRFEIVGNYGSLNSVDAVGDIAQEIFRAAGLNDRLEQHFNYPLLYLADGRFTVAQGKVELFAQVAALYEVEPTLMKSLMPKSFEFMESVYGKNSKVKDEPIGETRERLRKALQNPRADIADQGRVARESVAATGGNPDGAGNVRGPPGERVGRGTGADQGGAGSGTPTGGDVRSLNHGNTGGQWDVNEPGLIDNFIREFQNNKIDLHRVQNEIERVAGTLPDDANPRLAEELYKGRVRTRVVRFHKNAVEPMLKEIAHAKSGITVQDVGDYLWARHVPERNAQMAKINPGGPDNLAGMTDAEAAAKLAAFRAAGKTADLKSVAEKIDAIIASTQALMVKEKLESQSTIDAWNAVYKQYVPLFRDVEEPAQGMGFKVKGPESKRAMGSQKEAIAVVAAVIAQHEKALIRAEKAQIGRQLIKMAEDFPNPDFWRVDTPPTKRIINKSTGLVETIIDPLYKNREDIFVVKDEVGGKVVERVLAFNPKSERAVRLSKAMQNLDVVQLGAVTRIVGRVTRLMANLATSWNPVFWTTNLARDLQTAGVNLQATPLKGHAPQVISNIPHAQAGILDAEFRNGTGKWATLYREFEAAGGKMGFMDSFEDLIQRNKAINSLIKSSQRSGVNPVKWAEVAIDTIEKANAAVENGTRLSAYAEARKAGMSEKGAASLAKNLTVNFDRKGNRSAAIGAWFMFFNAQFQGTAILMKSIAKSRRVQAFVAAMVAFGASMELVNRMIGDADRDEDGNNPYELIPEHTRQSNMIFMLPKKDKEGTEIKDKGGNVVGRYASIPLPYGFSIFHNAGRMTMQAAVGNSKLTDEKESPIGMAMNFANALLQNFGPLGGASTPLQYFAPTAAKPFVQAAENKTWFGAPIHPEPQPFGKPKPNSDSFFRSTSDTAKDIAKMLSESTGGDSVKGGALDIYPGNIEHVFTTAAGGTGKFGLGMFDFTKHIVGRMTGDAEPDDMAWRNVPFVGKFYGEVDERDIASKYYRLSKEAQKTYKQYVEYKKQGETDKADALEKEHPELIDMGKEIAKRSHKNDMKRVREEFKAVDELPRSERPKARRELRRDEAGIMGEAIRAYNDGVAERRRETVK